jgi:hypothetical protein
MTYIPQHDPGVLAVAMPDEDVLLLHQDTSQYYSLNKTGSIIWKMMERSLCDADIVRELVDRFEVTPDAASGALSEFIHDLKNQSLISTSQARPQ